jgi:hypothetical protein
MKKRRRGPSTDYIRFDEIEDVVVSVELVAYLAPILDAHPSYWKWIIVAAHSALQGAMVCVLAQVDPRTAPGHQTATRSLPKQLRPLPSAPRLVHPKS